MSNCSLVTTRFVTTARFENVSDLMRCLHVLSLRHILSLDGDKTCRNVHSQHVLSPLRQQHYNLVFTSLDILCLCVCVRAHVCCCFFVFARARVCGARAHVCACVLMSIYPWQRARALACVVVYCVYYPRLNQC